MTIMTRTFIRIKCQGCGAVGEMEGDFDEYKDGNDFIPLYHICSDGSVGVCRITKLYPYVPINNNYFPNTIYKDLDKALRRSMIINGVIKEDDK